MSEKAVGHEVQDTRLLKSPRRIRKKAERNWRLARAYAKGLPLEFK